MTEKYKTLLIGGHGTIGSGLRKYLPSLNDSYKIVSLDLPGSRDKAGVADAQHDAVEFDVSKSPGELKSLIQNFDLVVYLARKSPLDEMNAMTDVVFEAVLAQEHPPMIVASSSVHAVDGLYSFYDESHEDYWNIAERNFNLVDPWPKRISAKTSAHVVGDYSKEKEYVEKWCKRIALEGYSSVAARWGGINEHNAVADVEERGYFSVWCHQEDSARFVHACYEAYLNNNLPSGAHYFVISDNDYNIFDIETPLNEIGYVSVHNAETHNN